jgi:hypothetical protein
MIGDQLVGMPCFLELILFLGVHVSSQLSQDLVHKLNTRR